MRHQLIIILFFSFLFKAALSQNYAVTLIPDSLKQNAHSVIRESIEDLEMMNINTGTKKIKKVVTVLDQNGVNDAVMVIHYDKNSKVQFRQANIYDKDGKRVKKIKQSEIMDIPAYDGATLYTDVRRYAYKPYYGDYPYTIEYEYEISCSNMISYEYWTPFEGFNSAVEHARFTFSHPSNLQFRKKEINLEGKSTITNVAGNVSETWEYKRTCARENEPYGISIWEKVPLVCLMPVQLAYDNHIGNADNWADYGKWVYNLWAGRDQLDEAEKTKIKEMLSNIPDTLQKIKKLYTYMQERTRYVSIQLGIGGLQPYPAQTVSSTGYGDCKALSNYMHALLGQISVASFPALVSSGRYIEPIYHDFPNFKQFDHAILCVPFRNDTIWLECTNQTIPFGFLGDFTDDRDVLLITSDGGIFAHTSRYAPPDNLKVNHAEFDISPDGTANCFIRTRYKGLQYDEISDLLTITPEEQRKWMLKNSDLPSLQLNNYTINSDKQLIPTVIIDESTTSRNYASFSGNYMILPLNILNPLGAIQKMTNPRTTDFMIPRSTIDYDTLVYKVPANYKIDFLPEGKTINTPFGDYTSSVKVVDRKIIYARRFELKQGRFKATEYNDFYEFTM
ncbi:MAG: DUF3857 domain-containing protein, partial [Bacteroidota bacterium]|nr:DUF3857 domain-containing protein [Bacteroidota bacterium]